MGEAGTVWIVETLVEKPITVIYTLHPIEFVISATEYDDIASCIVTYPTALCCI